MVTPLFVFGGVCLVFCVWWCVFGVLCLVGVCDVGGLCLVPVGVGGGRPGCSG